MFFSFSRAAFAAFFIGLVVLLIFQFRRRIISASASVMIFLILLVGFGSPFLVRLQSSGSPARFSQVSQALEISRENLLGAGRGSYTTALTEIQPNLTSWQIQPVHNFFVLKASEESILVVLTWLGVFATLGWWCFRQKKYEALAALVAVFILANFDHYLSTNFTAEATLWLVFAFVISELSEGKIVFRKNALKKSE